LHAQTIRFPRIEFTVHQVLFHSRPHCHLLPHHTNTFGTSGYQEDSTSIAQPQQRRQLHHHIINDMGFGFIGDPRSGMGIEKRREGVRDRGDTRSMSTSRVRPLMHILSMNARREHRFFSYFHPFFNRSGPENTLTVNDLCSQSCQWLLCGDRRHLQLYEGLNALTNPDTRTSSQPQYHEGSNASVNPETPKSSKRRP